MSVIDVRGSGAIFLNVNNSGWELVGLLTVPEHDSAFIEAKAVMEHDNYDEDDPETAIEDTDAVIGLEQFKTLYDKLHNALELSSEGRSVGGLVIEAMDELRSLLVDNYDERDIDEILK